MFTQKCTVCKVEKKYTWYIRKNKKRKVDECGRRWKRYTCPSCVNQENRKNTCQECYQKVRWLNSELICSKCDEDLQTFILKPQKRFFRKCVICKSDCGDNYFFCLEHIRKDESYFFNYTIV